MNENISESFPALLASDGLTREGGAHTDTTPLVQTFAEHIRRARLESVAIFLLESQKPLTEVLRAGVTALQPLGEACIGKDRWKLLQSLLEDRARIEELICLLESPGTPSTAKATGAR